MNGLSNTLSPLNVVIPNKSDSPTHFKNANSLSASKSYSHLKHKYRVGLTSLSTSYSFATKSPSKPAENSLNNSLKLPSRMHSPKLAPLKLSPIKGHSSLDPLIRRPLKPDAVDLDDSIEFLTKLNQKTKREESFFSDERPKGIIGTGAITDFYSHYKKLDKVRDQNGYRSIKDSVYTAFLNKGENLNLLPSKIGLIRTNGDESQIGIK